MYAPDTRPWLDFAVIGAHKSGTTTLWHQLREHPQLSLPAAKEAPYFTTDPVYALGMRRYVRSFFGELEAAGSRGTVTPQYMAGSGSVSVAQAVSRMQRELPGIKLIALLRDPIERAISHHAMSTRRGDEQRPLELALSQQLAPGALAVARLPPRRDLPRDVRTRAFANGRYLVAGEYGRILALYRRHFPPEQMLVALTSELATDPGGLLGRIFSFLGVDDDWRPADLQARYLVGSGRSQLDPAQMASLRAALVEALPSAPPTIFDHVLNEWNTRPGAPPDSDLPAALRTRLERHFAPDGKLVEELFGFSVPWASGGASAAAPVADIAEPPALEERIAAALAQRRGLAVLSISEAQRALLDASWSTTVAPGDPAAGVWDVPAAAAALGAAVAGAGQFGAGGLRAALGRLLGGRRVALACPPSLLNALDGEAALEVTTFVALERPRELDRALASLALQRPAYDAVVATGGLAARLLCARAARELEVVALDLGPAAAEPTPATGELTSV